MLEEIIINLNKKINDSLESSDLKNIFESIATLKSPTILCGIGGSHTVSIFLEKILTAKNNIIATNIDVEEYFLHNTSNYSNLILVSHTGKNHGIKCLTNSSKNKYLFTTRKSKINNEKILQYNIKNRIKSFIAIEDTFIPLSILLCYYLNSYKLPFPIDFSIKDLNIKEFKNTDIIYDYNTKTCATFLETSFVEAGISSVTMHTKYSLCHGRSNLISNRESLVIYLINKESELDKKLNEELPKICNNICILKDENKDPIVADFYLTIKALSLLNHLNKNFNMEFIKVNYNKIVPTIYNFKGDLV